MYMKQIKKATWEIWDVIVAKFAQDENSTLKKDNAYDSYDSRMTMELNKTFVQGRNKHQGKKKH